jgi:hypothetical protein
MLEEKHNSAHPPEPQNANLPAGNTAGWAGPVGAVGILLLALVAYAPLRWAKFIWDDRLWLLHNPVVLHWDKLIMAWINLTQDPQYYPLVFTVFSLEYHTWGLNPVWYHLVNVLLQAVNGLLLWWLLVRLRIPGAWLAAAIFTIHPVQVETVGWVAEMKNLLSAFFYLLAALAYVRACGLDAPTDTLAARQLPPAHYHWNWYWCATALFVLALLAKTAGLALPVVLLALLWWKRGRIQWQDIRAVVPWFIVALLFAWITIHVERAASGAEGRPWDLTMVQRVLIAGRAWWFYPGKLLWPIPLLEVYRRWNVHTLGGWHWVYPIAAVGVFAAAWLLRRHLGRGFLAMLIIYTLLIGPVLGFISYYTMLYTFVADHYQYLSCIALIAGFSAALWRICQWAGTRAIPVFGICSAVILVFLADISYAQSLNYESSAYLWAHVLAYDPNSGEGNLGYGESLNTLGNRFHNKKRLHHAMLYLKKADRALPDNTYVHMGLAQLHQDLHQYRRAKWYWERVIDRIPKQVFAWSEYAWCCQRLHQYLLARKAYQRVVLLDPHNLGAIEELAALYLLAGENHKAQAMYQRAIRLNPALAHIPLRLPPWLEPHVSSTTRPARPPSQRLPAAKPAHAP